MKLVKFMFWYNVAFFVLCFAFFCWLMSSTPVRTGPAVLQLVAMAIFALQAYEWYLRDR